MKKYFIITIICFLFISTYSQCVYKIDEFTGDTTIANKYEKIGKDNFVSLNYVYIAIFKLGTRWTCAIQPESRKVQTIPKNDLVYFKFSDGTILKFESIESSTSDFRPGKPFGQGTNTTVWFNNVFFNINDTDIITLQQKTVIKIRCGIIDYEINKPEKIQEQISCVLSKIK